MEFHLNNNGSSARELIKINQHMQDDRKEVSSRITGEKEHISQEDESKLNEDAVDVNDERHLEAMHFKVCTPIGLQRSHQESQELAVCWERFLPLRSLKVLLVENDDSTRHVVSALLRNCGYEVAAVANGMQALKILVDVTSKVDLVLTEVVTPLLSGIGLLSKMMTHKNCNNIPVIMMSSHDSMSIVFKCLSKGAVDFLVKPIRKNELKNLWQHVWRKCHSYSGVHTTKKCTRLRSAEESDNNSGSNGEDDNGSSRLNFRDGSDNGSGTQSSWTKRAVEVDSPKPMSSWDQLADPPDSTCAQVIHSDPEALGNDWFPMTSTRGCESQEKELDLEIRRPRVQNVPLEIARNKSLAFVAGTNMDRVSETKSNKNDKHVENGHIEINVEGSRGKSKNQASTQLRFMENDCDPGIESALVDVPIGNSKNSVKKDGMTRDNDELPSLELSLKRLQDVRDIGTSGPVRNTLRHSDLSAFSRYNSIAVANQTHARNHSYSRIDNSSEAPKTESMQNLQSYSLNTPLNQQSNGSSNNNDVGSTTDNVFNKPMATEFQLMTSGKSETELASTSAAKFKGANLVRTTNHHHCHHHVVDIPDQLQLANNGELSQKNVPATDLHCGSSNTLNGSATGSNFGSNGIEGSCAAFNAKESNMEIENRLTGKDEAICGLGSERKSGPDQNRSAQREAALNKFRQKRKERCFEKKVRYHSRKKLAEQRPRVRGQFVRQALPKDKDKDKDEDAHS